MALVLMGCLLSLLSLSAHAVEEDRYGEIGDTFEQVLPPEVIEVLPEGLFSGEEESVWEAVGEMSSFSYLVRAVGRLMGFGLSDAVSMLARLVGILTLVALFHALGHTVSDSAAAPLLSFCSVLSVTGVAMTHHTLFIRMTGAFAERLGLLIGGMSPIMCTLYALGGNVRSAVVNHGALILLFNACELFCGHTVSAFAGVCTAMAILSSLFGGVNLKSLSSALKKAYALSFGFVMLLISFALGTGQVVSVRADTLAARSAKFVTGSVIPLVGGSVGDSLRALGGGVDVLRASLGVSGLVIVLLLLLPTLISLLLARFALILSSSVADMLGCEREGKLLGELGSVYSYMIAAVSISSVSFLFALQLFVRCTAALGGG